RKVAGLISHAAGLAAHSDGACLARISRRHMAPERGRPAPGLKRFRNCVADRGPAAAGSDFRHMNGNIRLKSRLLKGSRLLFNGRLLKRRVRWFYPRRLKCCLSLLLSSL